MKVCTRIVFRGAWGLAGLVWFRGAAPLQATPFFSNNPLSIARAYHTTTLLQNGKLLVAGGYNGSTVAISECYDPATGTWTTNGVLGAARYQHTATLLPNGQVLVAGGLNSSSRAIASAELYDPVSGAWTATGSMATARYQHTANLLTNGTVLVAGGEIANSVVTNSAEIYDPVSGTWSQTGPMGTARYGHTATLLGDGTVLAAGGWTPSITPSAELYNPATGTWSATGSMNFDRYGHTATLLPNGQVLAAAGIFLGEISSAELYNPATKSWTTTGSLNSERVFQTATLLPNGQALVVSGYYNHAAGLTTNSAEIYDPVRTNWTVAGLVNTGRAFHTATQLPGGQIVLVGGLNGTTYLSSVETYEPTNGNWTITGSMSAARLHPTLTLLTNGLALAAGGFGTNGNPTNTEVFNPAAGQWTATAGGLNAGRYYHTATLLTSGQVLVTGGFNGTSDLASVELFDPASGLWTEAAPLHAAREFHTATLLLNGQVLVAGGATYFPTDIPTNGAELYDPGTGTWLQTGPLNVARGQHTAVLLPNGKVMVMGGYATNYLSSVETYDPSTGTWTTNNPMNLQRVDHTSTLLPSGKVLVAGGYYPMAGGLRETEIFDPSSGTWTETGPLNFARRGHSATLLANGEVLVAGGEAPAAGSAEVYNPATGLWAVTNALNVNRSDLAMTLLTNGQVLAAGGAGSVSDLASAELYSVGLGYSNSWQPQLAAVNSPLTLGSNLTLAGSQFQSVAEGSGGNGSQDSAADYPLVQLRALESGESAFLAVTNWTTNSLTTVPLTNFPQGWALMTVFVDGIPSPSTLVEVVEGAATVTLSNLVQFFDFMARSVSVTTVPPGLAVTVTYNGSTAPPTNIGTYSVAAMVNDANYQGGATNTLQIEILRNFGVDASHFQDTNGIPETNWTQIFAEGQRFAFVKATEGLTGPDDPTMATNVANATQAGLLAGVYHFAHPENRPTTNGAVQEADHLLSYAGSAIGPGRLRPVLDIETGNGTLTPSEMSDWVLAFSQEVVSNRGAGATPIVYCTQPYANNNFDTRVAGNALWLQASGGGDPTYSSPPSNGFTNATGVFTNWAFWQYNISGSAGGISPIDLDVCHDDFAPLSSYLIPAPAGTFPIQSATLEDSGFHVAFTNVPGTHFTLVSATNVTTALSNWTVAGACLEVSPGEFQITDMQATNSPRRFYRVRSP
jgi:GH25 family lysozyme M1 (1,4-beta-N-acetylmuramidase)/N-acetylneuraminic acid mutarotase